eukprot:8682382-Lingulodinium_polyedra.AAC.1
MEDREEDIIMESDVEFMSFECKCCQCKAGKQHLEAAASSSPAASCSSVPVPNPGRGQQRQDTLKTIKGDIDDKCINKPAKVIIRKKKPMKGYIIDNTNSYIVGISKNRDLEFQQHLETLKEFINEDKI